MDSTDFGSFNTEITILTTNIKKKNQDNHASNYLLSCA